VKQLSLRIASLATAALAGLAPSLAQAHLVATGMGPIYDGISHFGLSPEDFLPVIALGFFAGLRSPRHARIALAMLTLAWLIGGIVVLAGLGAPPAALPVGTALLFLSIGGSLAVNWALPPLLVSVAAVALGLVRGAADLMDVTPTIAHVLTLLGMSASAFVVFALAASVTLPLSRVWMIAAARVGGSWLAAFGLLYAGWIVRYGPLVR
jgi:urease accessory protein